MIIEMDEDGQPEIVGYRKPKKGLTFDSLDLREAFCQAAVPENNKIPQVEKDTLECYFQGSVTNLDTQNRTVETNVRCFQQSLVEESIAQFSGKETTEVREALQLRVAEAKMRSSFKYKPVAVKVRPVLADTPPEFRIIRDIKGDPLADMPQLNPTPGDFKPTGRYTQERRDAFIKLHNIGFLWPKELRIIDDLMMKQYEGFAWDDSERGKFKPEYFPPVVMPVLEHTPWVKRNIPIPPGIFDKVCMMIKTKLDSGVYEPSSSSYRSPWFCVAKKDGSLRLVHSLEPLNAVRIQHSGLPPATDALAEHFAGRACGGIADLWRGYDERLLDEKSRDLTSFQTPFGALRLVTLPMGWTNSVPIFHEDVVYILKDEIPHVTQPYIDDVPVRGPRTRYSESLCGSEAEDGGGRVEKAGRDVGIRSEK